MNDASFGLQTKVYFKKIARIAIKEKFIKFLAFAAVIAFMVGFVVGEKMFKSFEDTQSGFFTIASAGIWLGIFNSIQNICKEHNIIKAEYRSGLNLASYVTAHALWQFVICLAQTVIILVVCLIFVDFEGGQIIDDFPHLENFITILLLTFGADMLGLMISAIADTPTTAMTIMPFVLIVQLILSGVLFPLEGLVGGVANITYSKWGMQAFASNSHILTLPTASQGMLGEMGQDAQKKDNDTFKAAVYGDAAKEFKPEKNEVFDYKHDYKDEVSNVLGSWGIIILITGVCYGVTIGVLKFKNRGS